MQGAEYQSAFVPVMRTEVSRDIKRRISDELVLDRPHGEACMFSHLLVQLHCEGIGRATGEQIPCSHTRHHRSHGGRNERASLSSRWLLYVGSPGARLFDESLGSPLGGKVGAVDCESVLVSITGNDLGESRILGGCVGNHYHANAFFTKK